MSRAEEQYLVSVIVPVYNVEKYLRKCVQSIIDQSYHNLEIILIDDGSTDSSGSICDEFAGQDKRITVIHQRNAGLAEARNHGVKQSDGEWISFVDSDDFIANTFIETLLNTAVDNDCEVAGIPFGTPFKDGETCELHPQADESTRTTVETEHDMQRDLLYQKVDTSAQWRIYKADFVRKNPFPAGLYYEDLAAVCNIIHDARQVAVVDDSGLYAYRMRSNSIIRQQYSHIKGESSLIVGPQLIKDITDWYPDLEVAAESRAFSLYRMVFAQIPTGRHATAQEHADRRALWGRLKQHRATVARDPHARSRERLAAGIACLGEGAFSLFCTLCRKMGLMQ
ncbi:glycosyltransferase family 2 protein [Bifidobacterium animalis]|uniref:glycosyltransferase family 2 protein n=1 Tax=Bifidobacterium animalis TaxID=28025 RepID=UPI003F935DEB